MLLLAALLGLVTDAAAQQTAVRFGRLWDGSRTIVDAVVVVEAGRVVRVGSGPKDVPAGAEVVDLRRYTVMPGLIDLHTHMTYFWDRPPGTRPLGQRRRPAVTVFLAQDNARRTLETGVTTVRDLGASNEIDFAMRDLIAMGAMVGPRCSSPARASRRAATGAGPIPRRCARTAEERIEAGSDWIKVYGSRGSFDSVETTQTVTFEEMKAVVDAAHAPAAQGRDSFVRRLGRQRRRARGRRFGRARHRSRRRDDRGDGEARHGLGADNRSQPLLRRRERRVRLRAEAIPPLQDYIERNLESTRRAVKAGVKLGMGSDAVYTMFGQNTRELGWFVKAGMTPAQALPSATTTAAELLGLEERSAVCAPGFFADIVAVEGEPAARTSRRRSPACAG